MFDLGFSCEQPWPTMGGFWRQRRWFDRHKLLLAVGLVIGIAARAENAPDRWWPAQTLPQGVVRTASQEEFPAPRLAFQMMAQSVAGLAARAANEGRGDELVWIANGNADEEDWFARLRANHPDLKERGTFGPWELVNRFAKRGIIKGYILYRLDRSAGEVNEYRPGMDCSVNVATSLAGLLDGIIVDEELEKEAKAHGLSLLLDVREKTQAWCFGAYRDRFNRRLLCAQDPRKPHIRDFAIAQKAFTVYGGGEPTASAIAWLEPLSPVLGWNGGDEFANTDLSTRYGQIQTATDWCMNLPVLMAASQNMPPVKAKSFDPATIDWSDRRSAVSFVQTDGDNVQWLEGNFFRGNASYWGSPERGKIPFGWSCCFAHLAQLCPPAIEYALATRTPNDFFIEWGGGYYYPDHFSMNRTNRWDLLALHARRTWALMKTTGTRIIGFNFVRLNSPDAHKACEVIASQTDELLGILAFEYDAYEAGAGKTFWVKDRNGIEVPVISARYSIWEHSNYRPRAGTPARIAREIRDTVDKTRPSELPRNDWVISHAWSWFRRAPGTDEEAENLPQFNARASGGVRGYLPVTWCGERLPGGIRVISPEELIWRLRIKHDPAQTKQFMSQFAP
jgi:hypothetical protein